MFVKSPGSILVYSKYTHDLPKFERILSSSLPGLEINFADAPERAEKYFPETTIFYGWGFPAAWLRRMPKLRWVQKMGAGVEAQPHRVADAFRQPVEARPRRPLGLRRQQPPGGERQQRQDHKHPPRQPAHAAARSSLEAWCDHGAIPATGSAHGELFLVLKPPNPGWFTPVTIVQYSRSRTRVCRDREPPIAHAIWRPADQHSSITYGRAPGPARWRPAIRPV